MKRGFTLLEIVIVIAISAVILGIVLFSFGSYRQREILKAATLEAVSVLRDARSKTVVAEGDSVYGVHFDIDQLVLFTGGVYDSDDESNQASILPTTLGLATTTIGVDEIIFSRLSGEASASGSIILYQLSDPTSSTTITISGAGIISSP